MIIEGEVELVLGPGQRGGVEASRGDGDHSVVVQLLENSRHVSHLQTRILL